MRVATRERLLRAEPGDTVEILVDVVNTGELIDGVTARVIGLPNGQITVEPALLPLFPDAQGQIALSIVVPTTQPAGLHPLTIEVVSHGAGNPTQHVDVDLSVSAHPSVRLSRSPRMVRARRSGRFVLSVENNGNVGLEVTLSAGHEDRRTTARFTPASLRVEPGAVAPVVLGVRGPRMLTGSEADRIVKVDLTARRVNSIPAMDETESEPELVRQTQVQLRQRPLISRGLLTIAILVLIIGLWAAVFLLGLTQVLSGDPMTKTAPASFFPAAAGTSAGAAGADGAAGGEDAAGAGATAGAPVAPAGAMQKTGLLAPGVGGEISGVVSATSSQQPIGRILVKAFRDGRDGPQLVSSAATQSDGTYSLAGLFPTRYRLQFSAKGYETVWYPAAPARSGAKRVTVAAQGTTEGVDAVITGLDAQISGVVDPGSSLKPFPTQVVARVLGNSEVVGPVARATTGPTGGYTLTGLPAPATYELSFTSPGYQATKVVTEVGGGEQRLQPNVLLSAGAGQISGSVTDKGLPLGGVTVTTTVAGEDVSVITPTVGAVGSYVLGNLPTPGTYVLTFAAEGHGSATSIVELEAGQSASVGDTKLPAGTGSVSGVVVGPGGAGLGGVTVEVGGAVVAGGSSTTGTTGTTGTDGTTGTTGDPATTSAGSSAPSTTTLTAGAVGSFSLSGLAAPGDYTLTFTLDGYAPETLPITLAAEGPAPTVKMRLSTELGSITGAVTGPTGNRVVGATVTASNGTRTYSATTSAPGGVLPDGGYLLPGLRPGTYAVTVTADGLRQQTALVVVRAGKRVTQSLRLGDGT